MYSWLGCLVLWKIPGATDLSCATNVLFSSLDLIQLWFFHAVSVISLLYDFPLPRPLPFLALHPTIAPCGWMAEVVPHV